MSRPKLTYGVLVAAAVALLAVPTARAQTAPAPDAGPEPVSSGRQAVDELGADLADVAEDYGLSAQQLRNRLLADPTLAVDDGGELLYVDEPAPGEPPAPEGSVEADTDPAPAPPTTDPAFDLHSLPGADHTIYLDFDGHTTTGTTWNSAYNLPTIVSPPYDIDGSADTWSATEISRIALAWAYVAEDFAPFDVDVTTEEPPTADLMRSGSGDTRWGVRVVVTKDTWASCGCGGHAYIGAFDDPTDEPAFVYNSSLTGVAEASSHEVGHTMNLAHDGQGTSAYYGGHGSGATSWGPIMGSAYNRSVTHWSRGEYLNATNNTSSANYGNGPDDLAVIASLTNGNGFGFRPDDHGDTIASATALPGLSPAASGLITTTQDVDVFRFSTGAGTIGIQLDPAAPGTNLDIRARLLDAAGGLVAEADNATSLSATLAVVVPAGTYHLTVDGTGTGSPLATPPTGYTEYGSIGRYQLSTTTLPVPAGAITGAVRDDVTGAPVPGAWVIAVDRSTGGVVAATADGLGAFAAAVAAGTHHLLTLDPSGDHAGEWFDDQALDGSPTVVAAGTTGLEVGLAPSGRTASVAGVVTDDTTGAPLGGIWVAAVGPFPGSSALDGGTVTDGQGRYTIPGLQAGDHLLVFVDPTGSHAVEFHRDSPTPDGSTMVGLTAGTQSDVDASLGAATAAPPGDATVTGRVTETGTGAPIAGAWVVALATTGSFAGATTADAQGEYRLAVPPGGYHLEFIDPSATHRGEWHLDTAIEDLGGADQVVVTAAGATVDADLDPSGPTAALAGTVTGVGGAPVPGAWVVVLDPATGALVKGAVTGVDGTYRVDGLTAGPALVAFLDPAGLHSVEYHDDAAGFADADPVALVPGTTTSLPAVLGPA